MQGANWQLLNTREQMEKFDAGAVAQVKIAGPGATRKILDCLSLPSRAPPMAPANLTHSDQPDWF